MSTARLSFPGRRRGAGCRRAFGLAALALALAPAGGAAQTISHRGSIDARIVAFPEEAPNDPTRVVGDAVLREEVVLRPADWVQFAVGADLRANTHREVEDEWRLDIEDRGLLRPRAAVRRLGVTLTRGRFSIEAGKQFIRWGRADIIYPTDRFAPRDFLNVIDSELLPVLGARPSLQIGSETFEAVWVPRLTPSRLPLLDQRWAIAPADVTVPLRNAESRIPRGTQFGARWRHTGNRFETAVMFFDGFNHQPDIDATLAPEAGAIDVAYIYPSIRMYGADVAIPTSWFLLKGEAAYVTSPPATSDEYVLYVVEVERQLGEWLLDVGYAGDVVRESRAPLAFSPDRQMARSFIGRAAYTINPRRTLIIEGAARQNGEGFYGKIQYGHAMGPFWRLTLAVVGLGGDDSDFLGQYVRNSHASAALRFSF
jgi:hypothetical protein